MLIHFMNLIHQEQLKPETQYLLAPTSPATEPLPYVPQHEKHPFFPRRRENAD